MIRRMVVGYVRGVYEVASRVTDASAVLLRRAGVSEGILRGAETYDELVDAAVARVRELLEQPEDAPAVDAAAKRERAHPRDEPARGAVDEQVLRERFAALLEQSRAAEAPDGIHPAFLLVVDQLSPDEARMIRLLCSDGTQPVVDVVAGPRIGSGSHTGNDDYDLIEADREFTALEAHIESELRQRAKAVRKTARLSPLGARLCAICLPPEGAATT